MTVMDLKLVLFFLLGFFSVSTAERQLEVRFKPATSTTYPHDGRPEVYIDGAWATICASDWDMNDAEVVCRELNKGYANSITVSGALPAVSDVGSYCVNTVKCYGHESLLSECVVTKRLRSGTSNDKGIVCYPPPSDAGMKLTWGPDQYAGQVSVKLASGSWSWLYYEYWGDWATHNVKPASICRQLGFGELNWWEVYAYSSAYPMTQVSSCAYGIADHRSCTYGSRSTQYQAIVGCQKPGSIPCSAPYVPPHSTVQDLRLNYNFADKVNVTCDASGSTVTLQCHNKGLWSGPVISCPPPALLEPPAAGLVAAGKAQCSAPAVPLDSNIQNLRLSYKHKDKINVTCNEVTNGVPEWFELTCANGIWNGQNIVCPQPVIECKQPILPVDSSVKTIRARYKIGDNVNITCNSAFVSFVWICHKDGLWRGPVASCQDSQPPNGGAAAGRIGNKEPEDKQDGRNVFITGLLVAAVIMFVLVLMSMVAFSISFKGRSFGPSKHSLQDEKTDRGPLPDVPAGYADYLVGDKSLYTAPYLKPDEIHHSYETYEKPI